MFASKLTLAVFTACAAFAKGQDDTIVDIAVGNGNFGTLVAALTAAGLVDTLSGPGPYTCFAPLDSAFAALPEGTVDGLLADIPALTDVLLAHCVSGNVMSADVTSGPIETLSGYEVTAVVSDEGITIDGANVVTADIIGSNGVIHVIDKVIVPDAPADAPADEPAVLPATTVPAAAPKTIVDIAVEAGSFQTLVAAVTAAGLVETLSGDGPFTVFAPTDDAFAALPAGTVEALLADIPALTNVLLAHVVSGNVTSADVTSGPIATLSGYEVTAVVSEDGTITVDGANVVSADIIGSNGVIHVIDKVIVPAPEEPADAPADEMADEMADAPADEMADAPADEMADAPADEMADAPTDEMADAPADEMADAPADEMADATSSGTTAAATAAVISAGVAMMFI